MNEDHMSASERWCRHYFSCDVCQISPERPEHDRLCQIGGELRAASIADMHKASAATASLSSSAPESAQGGSLLPPTPDPALVPISFLAPGPEPVPPEKGAGAR